MRNLRRNKGAQIGFVLVMLLVISAIAAPLLAPNDPLKMAIRDRLKPPTLVHPLGTDQLGRDILSRVLFGGRLSLILGIVSVVMGGSVGILIGLVSGYNGGWIDNLLMRFIDMLMAMPSILLAMTIAFALGPSLLNLMIAVGVGQSPTFARLIRGAVFSAKRTIYVEAARVTGCSSGRILFRHVLPNVIAPAVVLGTLSLASAILSAATLNYLGMGVQPPTPEWGNMISEGRDKLDIAWWVTVGPGAAVMMSVLGTNLLGDGLRDALDPKLRVA
jgi:peptide/nickel transport system permease protein